MAMSSVSVKEIINPHHNTSPIKKRNGFLICAFVAQSIFLRARISSNCFILKYKSSSTTAIIMIAKIVIRAILTPLRKYEKSSALMTLCSCALIEVVSQRSPIFSIMSLYWGRIVVSCLCSFSL